MPNTHSEKKLPSVERPWLKYYDEAAMHSALPGGTMYQYIWESNREHLEETVFRYFGTTYSYRQLFDNVHAAAKAFHAMGVREGDVVTIMSMHTPENMFSIYALNYIGATANLVYATLTSSELLENLEHTGSKALVVLEPVLENLEEIWSTIDIPVIMIDVADSMPLIKKTIVHVFEKKIHHRYLTWKEFLQKGEGDAPMATDPHAHAVIVYTSGTTGKPKGVVLTNANLNALSMMIDLSGKKYDRGATTLMILPSFFGFGISILHYGIRHGINMKLWLDLDYDSIGRAFQKEKPNYFIGGPSLIDGFMRNVHGSLDYLMDFTGGGDELTLEKERKVNRFMAEHGCTVNYTGGYGMTELASVVSMQVTSRYREGSIGIPLLHCNAKVIDPETGEELGYNEIGELYFSSPALMPEYYKDEASTSAAVSTDENGERWLQTGDLGHIDEDGYLFFDGRIKRIYVVRGHGGSYISKLFPQRIEELIAAHPMVESCAVDVVPDAVRENVPVAYITVKKEPENADADEGENTEHLVAELTEMLHRELPDYLWPTGIHVIDRIPTTMNGKVDYKALSSSVR